jgi:hypothetical protein
MMTPIPQIKGVPMKPKMTPTEHVALVKDALDATLTARLAYDKWQEATIGPGELKFMQMNDTDWDRLRLEGMVKDPITKAIRKQIKDLGKELFKLLGTTDAMRATLEEVADRLPKHYSWRVTILDKGWDGIGDGADRWWS